MGEQDGENIMRFIISLWVGGVAAGGQARMLLCCQVNVCVSACVFGGGVADHQLAPSFPLINSHFSNFLSSSANIGTF